MVKIISDSTSDLSQDLLDRYNITLVPLIVRLGDQQYEDRVNITSEEIFRWSDSTKKAPTTACANVWTIQGIPLIIVPNPATSSPPTRISRKSAIQAHCLHAK